MKKKITLFVSIITLTLFASVQSGALSLDVIEKTVSVPNVLPINKCAKWHVNFKGLKKTVIYSDYIISMGKYGGFACLDYNTLKFDESFTNKLNSDFFTNIACYNDTLFAEKFDEIFYWSKKDNSWVKYDNRLPVKFFDIIYQDDRYIFYPIDGGEWGSLLYIYDKAKNVTKGVTTPSCTNAIVKTDGKYLISGSTMHMIGFSDLFTLQNIESMPVLVDHSKDLSINKIEDYWNDNIQYVNKKFKIDESNKSVYYNLERYLSGTIISSTFLFKNEIYHFIDHSDIDLFNGHSYSLLSKNENGKIVQQDSVNTFYGVNFTNSYNGDYVFNCYDGYMIIQKDKLIRIEFEPKASYEMKENYLRESGGLSFDVVPTFTLFEKQVDPSSIAKEKMNKGDNGFNLRNTNYQINNDAFIHTEYSDKYTEEFNYIYDHKIFINYKGQEKRLKFDNSNNILLYCFKSVGTDFLYFYCLGNVNHKYGLIEITDLEKFVNVYSI